MASNYQKPVAIVGLACRLPGNNNSPEQLWKFLINGEIAGLNSPPSRFNLNGHYDSTLRKQTMRSPGGMFINADLHDVDAGFFGLSQVDATSMDPQQRQLLEVVYEGLENAGLPMESIKSKSFGCFVGSYASDYSDIQTRDPEDRAASFTIGCSRAMLSNRISHFFDLKGPSMTVDTACSGSLISLDLACRYLDSGDADGAIVAGCNLYMSPEHNMDQAAMIAASSVSGRCWTFDARADGYIKAEAINCLVLKRLDDALRDGDPIRAVIRGTSTNSDGWTPGIASPSAEAQAVAIRRAYERAGITRLEDTAYLECHGTGTLAGDPIECRAASSVFSASRSRADVMPLRIGSIKSNIGHSEPAAGLSGMLKAVLAVERGLIPGNPTFEIPNPKIDFVASKIQASKATTSWPEAMLRRASVNSFGFGGSNAHAIVEHPMVLHPNHEEKWVTSYTFSSDDLFRHDEDENQAPQLLIFSANDDASLKASVRELLRHLSDPAVNIDPLDLAYTLSQRRTRHFYRAYVVSQGSKFRESQVVYGKLRESPRIGLVFTGQGAQWPQMGRDLLAHYPVARSTIDHLDRTLQSMPEPPSWTLREELINPRSSEHMRLPQYSQPLVTALQLALVAVMHDLGLKPAMVVGHSSGEIAAAVAAGMLSPEDGIKVAWLRGKVAEASLASQESKLGMLAVGLSMDETLKYLDFSSSITVACHNSPKSVTLSGRVQDLEHLQHAIKADGHFARLLMVELAYHSPYMEGVAEDYRILLMRHCPALWKRHTSTNIQFVSTVEGKIRDSPTDANYWVSNMVNPVLFWQGISAMAGEGGVEHLIEIGPSGALAGPINQIKQALAIGQGSGFEYSTALARGEGSIRSLFELAGTLFFSGLDLNFAKVGSQDTQARGQPRIIIDLPNYQWNHSVKYWHESLASKDWRYRPFPLHDLLGTKVLGTVWSKPTFRKTLRLNEVPWIRDHKLGPNIVFPGSAYIAMAVEAVFQMEKASGLELLAGVNTVEEASYHLRDVKLLRALVLQENMDHHLFLSCYPAQGPTQSWRRFQISSLRDNAWTEHCTGFVRISLPRPLEPKTALEPLRSPSPAARWYKPFKRVGFNFGPQFRNLTEIEAIAGQRKSRARISIPPPQVEQSRYAIHPTILDAFFQAAVPSLYQGYPTLVDKTLVPQLVDEIIIYSCQEAPRTGIAETNSQFLNGRPDKTENYKVNAVVDNESSGALLSEIMGLRFTEIDVPEAAESPQNLMKLRWEADISLLRQDTDIERLVSSSPVAKVVSQALDLPQSAAFMLSLLNHKLATPAVLHLDMLEDEHAGVEVAMATFGPQFRSLRRYSYVCKTPHNYADAQRRFGTIPFMDFHIHDTENAQALPFGVEELFDMVILDMIATGKDSTESALVTAASVCSKTGFLVLVQHGADLEDGAEVSLGCSSSETCAESSRNTTGYEALLQSAGFDIQIKHRTFDPLFPAVVTTVYLCTVSSLRSPAADVHRFSVVDLSAGSSAECTALIKSLRDAHLTGEITDLSGANALPQEGPVLLLDSPKTPILANISAEPDWSDLRNLLKSRRHILWLTSGSQMSVSSPSGALVHGLLRSFRGEEPSSVVKTLDLSSFQSPYATRSIVRAIESLHVGAGDANDKVIVASENEYCERDGVVYISRVVLDESLPIAIQAMENVWFRQNPSNVRLFCEKVGAMGSLHFNEVPTETLGDGEVEVEVRAAGVNYKDIATSLGIVSEDEHRLGYESSGTITRVGRLVTAYKVGDRVGYLRKGSFANRVRVPKENLFLMPDTMTFEEAATISIVFFTAVYSLMEIGRIKKGQSVLIHSAAGGVGLASIQLCRHLGVEIFATVGTEEKKDVLTHQYGIPPERIFSSRTTEFATGIRRLTNGRGIDFVLNHLTGELLDESWRLLADNGMLLEIGKKDIVNRNSLPMEPFDRNCSYRGIDIVKPSVSDDLALVERTVQTIRSLLLKGVIGPISPMKTFSFSQIPDALRYMRPGDHMGKIVISDGDANDVKVPVRRAAPRLTLHSEYAYLIVGGLKGLCGSLAVYMARHGAKRIIVMSRSGLDDDPRCVQVVRDLTSLGVTVKIEKGDVARLQDVERVFRTSKVRIKGVIQGSMVLRDKTLESMSLHEYHEPLACKVAGTWNVHHAAAETQSEKLDFFTLLSSISGIVGTASQANYAAGNSFQDAFAQYRHSLGLSAHSVNLGIVEDVGYMSEHQALSDRVSSRTGLLGITERQLHEILKLSILQQTSPSSATVAGQMVTGLPFPLTMESPLATDMRFHSLISRTPQSAVPGGVIGDSDGTQAFRAMVRGSLSGEKLIEEACKMINRQLVHVLGLPTDVEESKPLSTYGIDSLAAVDLRNWFKAKVGVEMTTLDLLNALNLRSMSKTVVERALEACKLQQKV